MSHLTGNKSQPHLSLRVGPPSRPYASAARRLLYRVALLALLLSVFVFLAAPGTSLASSDLRRRSYGLVDYIDVDLSNQVLTAYQDDTVVLQTYISSGTDEYPTPTGTYYIEWQAPYVDMEGPGYYLPDVPYVMAFIGNYALHGTYWHDNFGTPMSHGCINLSIDDAAWLYDRVVEGTPLYIHY